MNVAVIILNWNTKDYLRRFLPPLVESVEYFNALSLQTDGDKAEIVVADSASADGSVAFVNESFPEIRTIPLDRNYGFTGGYNRAIEQLARENKYDLYILLNSDIEVGKNWLVPLVEWMKNHPECAACGPKLHNWYRKDQFEYAGAAGGLIDRFGYPFCRGRIMKKLETDRGQYDTPADVLWVTGAALVVRAEVWRNLGGLDDRFFAHMEEIDLCWRMQLAGWKVTVVPESTVWHLGGGTLPSDSPQKLYLNYRNNILLLENNLAPTIGRRKAAARIFFRKILDGAAAAVYLLSFKPDCFKAVLRAHRDAGMLKRQRSQSGSPVNTHVTGLYRGCMIPRAVLGLKIDTEFKI